MLKCGSVEDYNTEPEHEDNLTTSPHRKCSRKQGTKNHLHDSFHKYLQEKHLLNYKNGPLPQSPPSHVVEAYNHDNDNAPTLDKITIDWQDSLRSSVWNTEAIDLLVVDFQEKVKTGSFPLVIFDDDTMNLNNLHMLCINKLHRTQQAYREHIKIKGFTDSQQREVATRDLSTHNSRRQHLDWCNTRKHGMLGRREKIIKQNRHHNPQSWDMIKRIIDWLDLDGMSGDETNTPPGVKPKIVRHVAIPWISLAITDLLHAVESYTPTVYEENMSVPAAIATAQAKRFLDLQAQVDREEMIDEIEDEEDNNTFVVPNDQASDNDQSPLLDPRQNKAAWDIMQAFLKTDMQYDEMERQLASHLDEQYHAEDWTEAKRVLFSGDGDNQLSLVNLLPLKKQHITLVKLDRVHQIQDKYTSGSTLSPVQASLRPPM
ncbi:hypothetical protein BDR05DRAFT_1003630 [Suillus weaverae]|nr:hypothetical protein BDR05DRAFT_1003630 [Suillus weaverae]